jgi:hypothetical protein
MDVDGAAASVTSVTGEGVGQGREPQGREPQGRNSDDVVGGARSFDAVVVDAAPARMQKARNRLDESGGSQSPAEEVADVPVCVADAASARKPRVRNRFDESGGSQSSAVDIPDAHVAVAPRRRKGRKRGGDDGGVPEVTRVTEAMSLQVAGSLDDEKMCKARVWAPRGLCPGSQCSTKPVDGSDFCKRHGEDRWKAHGRIDEVVSLVLYEKFQKEWQKRQSTDSKRRSKHWYTRHHMWMSAVNARKKTMKERPELGRGLLEELDDLTDVEKDAALEATTNLLKHPNKRRRHGGDFVEQGAGPCNKNELGNEELASYNGKGGGRFWKWYEPGVFEQQLKILRTDFETCTERQCVEALRLTHTVLERAKQSGKGALGAVQRAAVLFASEELEEGPCSAAGQCV